MNKLLSIKNLSKVYYKGKMETEAIKDISFDIEEKEFVSIVGPSGCGKSTLLNILTNMDTLTKGSINLKENLKLGYMLQSDSMLEWLTVLDNALLGLDIKKIKTKENIEYVKSLFKKYGLAEFMNKYPSELSGGMRQRVVCI